MEKKQTAVYFLYRFFNDNPEATTEEGYEVYKQALEMEKEQIIKARQDIYTTGNLSAEQYYNETYKSE